MGAVPFRVPLDAPVSRLAAGEKQKVEILKQLYLHRRFMILDEPTSVLTPQEADEVLGLLKQLTRRNAITVLMITHKFREVMAYADHVTVLRRGNFAGSGAVADLTPAAMAQMMIGSRETTAVHPRTAAATSNGRVRLSVEALFVDDDSGLPAVNGVSLDVRSGEVLGIAGVSGNGQRELVEALIGQRRATGGRVLVEGERYRATRTQMREHRVFSLPEEPLRNACVADRSVAENLALRHFDRAPLALGMLLRTNAVRAQAERLIAEYKVKTAGADAPMRSLSGGNVQRAVLARELSNNVSVLIAANPVFGLDFAAVAEIHTRILAARDDGAAVLLVSEDLDELLELSDRIAVMFDGRLVHQATRGAVDVGVIGRCMAGHVESVSEVAAV
jgi:simple sugar transport system ATP-binding protein